VGDEASQATEPEIIPIGLGDQVLRRVQRIDAEPFGGRVEADALQRRKAPIDSGLMVDGRVIEVDAKNARRGGLVLVVLGDIGSGS
jgi:hypothetical protein